MPDFNTLDKTFRLTPWSDQTHADFIAGRYGAMLQDPASADAYVQSYVDAEKRFDEAYQHQRDMLAQSSKVAGSDPQTLPDIPKIVWNPKLRFANAAEAAKHVKTAKAASRKKAS